MTPHLDLSVPRQTRHLGMVRKVVAAAAQECGFDLEDVDKIELAVDEACSNAVVHGGPDAPPTIELRVVLAEAALEVTLRDGGPRYPFEERGNFDLAQKLQEEGHGGLGIYIMKTFMDEVTYRYSPNQGSVLVLRKLRPVSAGV